MKKKLLIASDNFLPRWDGIARFLLEVLPALSNRYDITLIVPTFNSGKKNIEEMESLKKVKIVRIPTFKFVVGDFTPAKFEFRLIAKHVKEADLIWTQTIGPIGGAAIYVAKKEKKKIMSYVHSVEWELVSKSIGVHEIFKRSARGLTKKVAQFLYNKCDLMLVPSLEVAEIMGWQKIKTKKKVIHLGTDTEKFVPPKSREDAKQKIGVSPSKNVVGFVGRLGREKSLITLHRAFLRIHKKRDDIVLLIVGDGVPEIRNLFENKSGIIFAGSQDNVVPYLQAMDIFVLPSLTETSSLATMEAMACGCAVITTPVGYVKDYIIENYNGMFFPQKEFFVLSKKIEKLLDNEKLTKKLGENGRKTIVNQYPWSKTIKEIEEALEGLVDK